MIGLIQVTIPAVGSQPVRVSATRILACHIIIEADDGNANAAFVGDSNMAANGSEGIRLNNSATVPGNHELGPFQANYMDLSEVYIVGTADEKVNVLYVQH